MDRIRYEVDPNNRLVARSGHGNGSLTRFRRVMEGTFAIGKRNTLDYHLKSSSSGTQPQQIKLRGTWALDKNHDLVFTLDKWDPKVYAGRLIIKGDIIAVSGNALTFSVRTRDARDNTGVYLLTLTGCWQADSRNRLTFTVDRRRDDADTLTFQGAWEINKRQEIVYRYAKRYGRHKTTVTNELTFQGRWDIHDKARIEYILDKGAGSAFDFKTGLGIYNAHRIQYELAIRLAGGQKPLKRTLTLDGTWKVTKDTGLSFELSGDRRLVFGAQVGLSRRDRVVLRLSGASGRFIGSEVELSRTTIHGDGTMFIRFLQEHGATAIAFGAGWGW